MGQALRFRSHAFIRPVRRVLKYLLQKDARIASGLAWAAETRQRDSSYALSLPSDLASSHTYTNGALRRSVGISDHVRMRCRPDGRSIIHRRRSLAASLSRRAFARTPSESSFIGGADRRAASSARPELSGAILRLRRAGRTHRRHRPHRRPEASAREAAVQPLRDTTHRPEYGHQPRPRNDDVRTPHRTERLAPSSPACPPAPTDEVAAGKRDRAPHSAITRPLHDCGTPASRDP